MARPLGGLAYLFWGHRVGRCPPVRRAPTLRQEPQLPATDESVLNYLLVAVYTMERALWSGSFPRRRALAFWPGAESIRP